MLTNSGASCHMGRGWVHPSNVPGTAGLEPGSLLHVVRSSTEGFQAGSHLYRRPLGIHRLLPPLPAQIESIPGTETSSTVSMGRNHHAFVELILGPSASSKLYYMKSVFPAGTIPQS